MNVRVSRKTTLRLFEFLEEAVRFFHQPENYENARTSATFYALCERDLIDLIESLDKAREAAARNRD